MHECLCQFRVEWLPFAKHTLQQCFVISDLSDGFQKAEDISVNRCMVCCFQPAANGARVTSFHKSALAMKRFIGGLV